ncbi:zf-HC2 domain-containing protein [Granulicella sibirica]|uniref:zf-HC2 domain-containing protein n=1 Tax=Granulicella sibirica TaxID=2479048 RepID=UPI0010090148|nr:zf-HC2 domain-containing protein [Granulicella sibirica]
MNFNFHETFQQMVDESLAGTISAEKKQSLREHLSTCVPCQEYLSATNRVIAGLSGFSFEVNPTLNAKVLAALRLQAEQVRSARPRRLQFMRRHIVEFKVWAAFAVALLLSIVGSAFVYEVATLLLHFETVQVRTDVLIFWLLPSFCVTLCLLVTPSDKRGIA